MSKKNYICLIISVFVFYCCSEPEQPEIKPIEPNQKDSIDAVSINRAEQIFDKIFEYYWTADKEGNPRLYGAYPHAETEDYWVKYSAVWGYGAFLSAYNAIYQRTESFTSFKQKYEARVMDGLEEYWNEERKPAAYGSYFNSWDDRFYDDNVWLGIDLIELYNKTKNNEYLERAKLVWTYIMSGKDNELGGGVYWKEGDYTSKNTCSNAPVAVFGVKLYQSTKDKNYLDTAVEIYHWTKKNLQDPSDYLYWDNKRVATGTVEKNKFSYNSGQMIQAGVLLYNVTETKSYLDEAKQVAEAAYKKYFYNYSVSGESIKVLEKGDLWFHAIMFRGFAELYELDKDAKYITSFKKMLDYAWRNAREEGSGLFNSDMSGSSVDESKDIRTESAIAEMYARIATLN